MMEFSVFLYVVSVASYVSCLKLLEFVKLALANQSISELIHLARWVKFNPRFNPGLALIEVLRNRALVRMLWGDRISVARCSQFDYGHCKLNRKVVSSSHVILFVLTKLQDLVPLETTLQSLCGTIRTSGNATRVA